MTTPVPSPTPITSPSVTPVPSPPLDPSATPTPSATATPDAVQVVAETTFDVFSLVWRVGAAALVGAVIAVALVFALRVMSRRRSFYTHFVEHCRIPMVALGAVAGGYIGGQIAVPALSKDGVAPGWTTEALHVLLIAVIAALTLLVVSLTKAVEGIVVEGVRARGEPGRTNRVTTQAQILRRVAKALIIICGMVGVIMTFPAARVAMGSLLASAGIVSVVMGLAAQSALGNVFAGIQLASTDAIRVGDTVVVQKDQQGVIEEITLTYVVMRTWDERRLILPSTHFTENPFANWTRGGSQSTGTFTLDLDWRVPIAALRAELARLVAASTVWDGRQATLDVSDAVGDHVTVRVVLTGATPGAVGDLKSYVREELVTWLQREAPYALPRTRVEVEQVEVTQDLSAEQVAQAAEEIVAKQKAAGADDTIETAADDSSGTTTEVEGETTAHGLGARRAVRLGRAMGRSLLHRARRGGLGPR